MLRPLLALVLLFSAALPCLAGTYSFGFSFNDGGEQFSANGAPAQVISVLGQYRNDGFHDSLNDNFLAGTVGVNAYRNFFVLDLSHLSGPVTSAALQFDTFTISGASTFLLFAPTLNGSVANDAAHDVATYSALGTGAVIGSIALDPSDANSFIVVNLNSAGLAALTAAEGRSDFVLGGEVAPASSAIPEPTTLCLVLTGIAAPLLRRRPA